MNARSAALARLVHQCRQFPQLDLAPLETGDLDPRDAALAAAIDHAVSRRWITLQAVLEHHLQPAWPDLEPKLQAVLLAGAAQLLLLERLPDHAVINESVEWAKRHIRNKAAGIVNAVLRKVAASRIGIDVHTAGDPMDASQLPLSDGRVLRLAEPVFAENPLERLAQQTSNPLPLLSHWIGTFGQPEAIRVALHGLVIPPIALSGVDRAAHPHLRPHQIPGHVIHVGDHSDLLSLLETNPGAIIHDPTSAAPVQATAALRPQLIMDMCAGKGTKTRQLAALHPQARIVATDVDQGRLATLRHQFDKDQRVEVIDPNRRREFDGLADLLVLDVPCSNTGVLARRVEARYRWSRTALEKLASLQRQIVADHVSLLAPGGRILYATCSIEPIENRQQAEWIVKWHRVRIAQERATMPESIPGDPPETYADGGYFALLERIDA